MAFLFCGKINRRTEDYEIILNQAVPQKIHLNRFWGT